MRGGQQREHIGNHEQVISDKLPKSDDAFLKGLEARIAISEERATATQSKHVVLGVFGASFFSIVGLASPFVLMQLRSPLPWMATPRHKVVSALRFIAKHLQQKQEHKSCLSHTEPPPVLRYYDLGSGDGTTVLAAASLGWRATGFELNSTLFLISILRRRWTTAMNYSPKRPIRCNFIWGDMWKQSICDANAVMIFGVTPLMPRIAQKIRAGTYVLSYRFLLPSSLDHTRNNQHLKKKNMMKNINKNSKGQLGSLRVMETTVGENKDDSVIRIGSVDESGTKDGMLNAELIYDREEMRVYCIRDCAFTQK